MNDTDFYTTKRHNTRLRNYDYSQDGLYFITICAKDRALMFGEIQNNEIYINGCGETANKIWELIPSVFSFSVLRGFVVMPNHVHVIIELTGAAINTGAINRALTDMGGAKGGISGGKNPMTAENLARIVRWYKGRTTYECRKYNTAFSWQRNYYDHIIRSEKDYMHIAEYIQNNPVKWQDDRFYPQTPPEHPLTP